MTADEVRLTKADALAAFSAAGVEISDHQLARWRREGLLPAVHQIGLGQGGGSKIEFERRTVEQAIKIARLYKEREKRSWVGWQLWLDGYPVDEQYWRPVIANARAGMIRVRKLARLLSSLPESMFGNEVRALARNWAGAPFSAAIRKLPVEGGRAVFGIGAEILGGRFVGFPTFENDPAKWPVASNEYRSADIERIAVTRAMGMPVGKKRINGITVNLNNSLEDALRDISGIISRLSEIERDFEPSLEIRQELHTVVQLAKALHSSLSQRPGRNVLGLVMLSRIVANPSVAVQASMLIIWAHLRERSRNLLSTAEVTRLAVQVIVLP